MFEYKNLKHKRQNQIVKVSVFGVNLFPVLLIVFTLLAMFLFIFGNNGFYAHKAKLTKIQQLQTKNQELYGQIQELQNKNRLLARVDHLVLEQEARKISLKKAGEVIIKIPDQDWIEQLAQVYKPQNEELASTEYHFLVEHKVFFSSLGILLIAFVSLFFMSTKVQRQ